MVSDSLLRSRASPLLSFLAPSIPPLWRSTTAARPARLLMLRLSKTHHSCIHTTARQRAKSSSTEADFDFLEEDLKPKPTPTSQRKSTDDILGKQLDSLLNPTFPTPNPTKRSPSEQGDESSATMIETAYRNSIRNRVDPGRPYHTRFRDMQFPAPIQETADVGSPSLFSRDAYRTLEPTRRTPKRAKRTVRSRPTVGRTVEVIPDRGMDVGRALRNLDIACSQNRVKQDLMRQRFHERPGMKRKRLKSERWRKMFRESFKATVMRVREMRRKGW